MAISFKAFENMYQDSVSLMQLSAQINQLPGIEACSVAMGTLPNLERMKEAGFGDITAAPNDLVIAVKGEATALEEAIVFATQKLTEKKTVSTSAGSFSLPNNSIALTLSNHPSANLVLLSVPGEYAAAEALKALKLGLNVMMFSDNVSMADELLIKSYAASKGLMVMGPDCGTAIINSIPLGFANVVRSGKIGIVAASGTGLQEATCRVHQLGEGISQALGTGGHDLHESIGGISMLTGLKALMQDDSTEVIVLISKPPAKVIADKILALATETTKPVVVHFLGATSTEFNFQKIHFADNLAHSAEMAVDLLRNKATPDVFKMPSLNLVARCLDAKQKLRPSQQYIRGVFAGGTFCYEAQLIAKHAGLSGYSNTPVKGFDALENVWHSKSHTFVDLGDDTFTQGRPHPMIDPTLRNERILQDALDETTAVLLFDIVIGYGASDTPVDELLPILDKIKSDNQSPPIFIAHVCGTDKDPQNRTAIIEKLITRDVIIADCNATAAQLAVTSVQAN